LKKSSIALTAMKFFEQIAKAFATQLSLRNFYFLTNLRLGISQQTSLKKSSNALAAMMMLFEQTFFEQIAKAFATQLSLQIVYYLTNLRLEFLRQTSLKKYAYSIALAAMMFFEQMRKAFATNLSLQIFDFLTNLRLEFLKQTSLKKS